MLIFRIFRIIIYLIFFVMLVIFSFTLLVYNLHSQGSCKAINFPARIFTICFNMPESWDLPCSFANSTLISNFINGALIICRIWSFFFLECLIFLNGFFFFFYTLKSYLEIHNLFFLILILIYVVGLRPPSYFYLLHKN